MLRRVCLSRKTCAKEKIFINRAIVLGKSCANVKKENASWLSGAICKRRAEAL